MNNEMRELFLLVSDICDNGDYLNLDDDYSHRLYVALENARETDLAKQWEKEERIKAKIEAVPYR